MTRRQFNCHAGLETLMISLTKTAARSNLHENKANSISIVSSFTFPDLHEGQTKLASWLEKSSFTHLLLVRAPSPISQPVVHVEN